MKNYQCLRNLLYHVLCIDNYTIIPMIGGFHDSFSIDTQPIVQSSMKNGKIAVCELLLLLVFESQLYPATTMRNR
jgi:hypothetical protein